MMEGNTDEEGEGLPEVYVSPSRSVKNVVSGQHSSEAESGAWDDTDTEQWIPLPAEVTTTQNLTITTEPSTSCLGQREEIEGGSSQESQNTSLVLADDHKENMVGKTPCVGIVKERTNVVQSCDLKNQHAINRENNRLTGQRGETPGSDCPHTASLGAFAKALQRPLVLDTQAGAADSTELVFSPGGDQGFMVVPSTAVDFDDSCSDTEALEWMSAYGAVGGVPALVPVRDAVEGADSATIPATNYLGVGSGGGPGIGMQDLQRNSPAGLSTPDGDLDVMVTSSSSGMNKKMEAATVRPPVVGQSEELEVVERKDLGSTDGEESSDDGQIRPPPRAPGLFCPTEVQPGSLGSQSENTDSVKTVVDIGRGEVQGCETDLALDTGAQANAAQMCLKPSFVVGGPISPRGKFRQFQNTVRDRMQDMKASLETQEEAPELDRERYLAQPPLFPTVTLVSEPEVSLASMVSVESTNPPESSERVTSPSVLSVSSAASSRRMEWDSGADVGYAGGAAVGTPETTLTSLSTLERIAIGSYASVLRTEPEGTTQVREKQRTGKRGGRIGSGRIGGQSASGRQHPALEGTTGSSTHSSPSHRAQQVYGSSSEEDLSHTTASPSQSPRRKPRRRSIASGSHEGDLRKRSAKGHLGLDRRLRELRQEHGEGKSSSLVELGKVGISSAKHCRSSSQYSLSLPHHLLDNFSNESSRSGSRGMAGTFNTSTSTSTLIPSVSPRPASASTSSTQVANPQPPSYSPRSTNSKHSSVSSIAVSESHHTNIRTSSSNNLSPRSQESTDLELWGGRETDNDSLTSHSFPRRHSHSLKARKNSENARNHESMTRQSGQAEIWKSKEYRQMDSTHSSTPSSSAVPHQNETQGSVEESGGESLHDSHAALQSLSVRLLARIQALGEAGCLGEGRDYHKLRDYATFIGIPAATEEERRLRQGVANVIMRMFGKIGGLDQTSESSHASDTLASDTFPLDTGTFHSATSSTLPSDMAPTAPSDISDTQSGRQWPPQGCKDAIHSPSQSPETHDRPEVEKGEEIQEKEKCPFSRNDKSVDNRSTREVSGEERCTTPGGTVVVVPYRPPSATRTYYMAVSQEYEGLVEGERAQDTCPAPSPVPVLSPPEPNRDGMVSRGQAEGWREEASSVPSPGVPSILTQQGGTEDWVGFSGDVWGEDHQAPSAAQDWWQHRPHVHSPTTSDDLSPTLHRPSWHMLRPTHWKEGGGDEDEGEEKEREEEEGRERAAAEWWAGQGRTGRLYQDRRGTYHLAQQPPGYQEDRDSHPSESPSDQDPRRPAPSRLPWTSSGSESAYETIRERHRRVDEALASSFEFYSTSPRPARLMSCTPPYGQNDGDDDVEENAGQLESPPTHLQSPPGIPSPPVSDPLLTSKSRSYSLNHPSYMDSHHTSPSTHTGTDGNDVSSQISLIQLQKQRHVRKIQRHILTLEKLEKALLDQLGDSLGSEGSFCRRVTEGRSHTETDNNDATHRATLGQSGTGTSSLASSDYSEQTNQRQLDKALQGQRQTSRPGGKATGSDAREPHESRVTLNRATGESHTSSPRATTSMISSDLTNSRASTMGQVEEEVWKLASTEEKSRQFLQRSREAKHRSRDGKQKSSTLEIKSLKREEPRGEEGPRQQPRTFQVPDVHSSQKSSSEVSPVTKRRPGGAVRVDNDLGIKGIAKSIRQPRAAWLLSEEEAGISDAHISRRGDGREAKDRGQVGKRKTGQKGDKNVAVTHSLHMKAASTTSSSSSSKAASTTSSTSSSAQGSPMVDRNKNDFGQMFPSTGNICLYGCSEVGIQTGDSLLYPSKKKRGVRTVGSGSSSSSSPSHSTTTTSTSTSTSSHRRVTEQQKGAECLKPDTPREISISIASATTDMTAGCNDKARSSRETRKITRKHKIMHEHEKKKRSISETKETSREPSHTKHRISAASTSRIRSTSEDDVGQRRKADGDYSKKNRHMSQHRRPQTGTSRDRVKSNQNDKVLTSRKESEREKSGGNKYIDMENIVNRKRDEELEALSGDRAESTSLSNRERGEEPEALGGDRAESTSQSEYYLPDTARDKSLSSLYSSESTSTGEVGEAEIEDEDENRIRQDSGGEHDGAQLGEDQARHLQHPAYRGTESAHTSGVGERAEHPVYVVSPPPGQRLRKNEGHIHSHTKVYSERQGHELPGSSDISEDSDALKRQRNQIMHTSGSQVKFTSIINTHTSDSQTPLHHRALAGQTDVRPDTIKQKKPVRFDIPLENKENYHPLRTTITVNMGLLPKKTADILSLQEALACAKPRYIREAGDRRALIRLKKEMRQSNQSRNHDLMAQIPSNLQTPSTLQRFLYKPDLSPLFTYRDIREQNRRLYSLLPESGCPVVRQKRCAERNTNRLMAKLYSQRLRKKVMKGQVSHAHKEIITPISTRTHRFQPPPTGY